MEFASKNAAAIPPSNIHFFRLTIHIVSISHARVKICGFAIGISNAAPARKGRWSSNRRNRAIPSNITIPICPATKHAATGAKR